MPYRNYGYTLELFYYELLKRKKWYLIWSGEDARYIETSSLRELIDTIVYTRTYFFGNYFKIGKLDISPFMNAKKIWLDGNFEIIDEINPGDPICEKEHSYVTSLRFPYGIAKPEIMLFKFKKDKH